MNTLLSSSSSSMAPTLTMKQKMASPTVASKAGQTPQYGEPKYSQAKLVNSADQAPFNDKTTRKGMVSFAHTLFSSNIQSFTTSTYLEYIPDTIEPVRSLAHVSEEDGEGVILRSFLVARQSHVSDEDGEGLILESFIIFAHQRYFARMTASCDSLGCSNSEGP